MGTGGEVRGYTPNNSSSRLLQLLVMFRPPTEKMRSSTWTRVAPLLGFGFKAEVKVATSLNILSTLADSCTIQLIRKTSELSIEEVLWKLLPVSNEMFRCSL